jgi:DNA repair protein RadD
MRSTIRRSGNIIQILPANEAILIPELTFTKRKQTGGNAKDCEYIPTMLYKQVDGTLVCPAGLTNRVAALLRAAGHEVVFEDRRDNHLPEPDLTRLPQLRKLQDDTLARIIVNDGGVIEEPTGAGKTFLIQVICRIWPKARIIICSYSKDIVRMFYNALNEQLPPHEIGMVGGGMHEMGRRITCAVDRSLMKCDVANADIFIYDEVHRAAAEMTKSVIYTCRKARMYGFSASPTGRGDNADLETEAMFGPIIAKHTYQEIQGTGAIVPMIAFRVGTDHLPKVIYSTTSALDRNGLWRNKHRNELIGQMVEWYEQYFGKDTQILVSVKTVEHAVHLSRYLPTFQMVYAAMNTERRQRYERDGLIRPGEHPITSDRREQLRLDFESGKLRRAIATGVWSTGVNFSGLNCVIRADGAGSVIANTQIPGRATRAVDGKEFGVVIDFDDVFSTTLEGRSDKRFAVYRKKGWTIQDIVKDAAVYQQMREAAKA